MKMIEHNHFICHFYSHFSVLSHNSIRKDMKFWKKSLMLSSNCVSKIISCCF